MLPNHRQFEAGPDPFGHVWQARFLWQQNGISIRHADTVDCKFIVNSGQGETEKVIALPHPLLLKLSAKTGEPLSDSWCMKLAAEHLRHMIETGEDIEKTLITLRASDMEAAHQAIGAGAGSHEMDPS
jgi:hypothetical protein